MLLQNPSFSISIKSTEQAAELIAETLRKKNWQQFEATKPQLILIPFFFFHYDAAFEERKQGKNIVKETKRGKLALNAATRELSEEIAAEAPAPSEGNLIKELPDQMKPEIQESVLSKEEAEKIAAIKTAALLGTALDSIVLSGFKKIYWPIWQISATIGEKGKEKKVEFQASAATGTVQGAEQVPERAKGSIEIIQETLQELKQPSAWLRYTKEIAAGAAGQAAAQGKKGSNGEKKQIWQLPQKPSFWITIALLIILAIVLAWIYL